MSESQEVVLTAGSRTWHLPSLPRSFRQQPSEAGTLTLEDIQAQIFLRPLT